MNFHVNDAKQPKRQKITSPPPSHNNTDPGSFMSYAWWQVISSFQRNNLSSFTSTFAS